MLFAPWRYKYVTSAASKNSKNRSCVFCEAPEKDEEEALVLYKGKHAYIIMNLYPYNTGHVMIVPYRHVPSIEDLNEEELLEISMLLKAVIIGAKKALKPHGFNVGVNIGKAAGAGIEDHVHVHVVPRWEGDTNFMPVVAETKVIPQDPRDTYKLLKPTILEAVQMLSLGGKKADS
ncbi:MAG: HIT domain-containing protein [Thermoproteota archaeon]